MDLGGNKKLIVGCPRGKWNKNSKRCSVGTKGQELLYPKYRNSGENKMRRKRKYAKRRGRRSGKAMWRVFTRKTRRAKFHATRKQFRKKRTAKKYAAKLKKSHRYKGVKVAKVKKSRR